MGGWRGHVYLWPIHVDVWQKSSQYCKVIILQLKTSPPANAKTQELRVRSLDLEDPLKEEMATHSTILAWKFPWTEKPGGLQSMGLQRVRHNCTHTHAGIQFIFA